MLNPGCQWRRYRLAGGGLCPSVPGTARRTLVLFRPGQSSAEPVLQYDLTIAGKREKGKDKRKPITYTRVDGFTFPFYLDSFI